MSQLPVKIKKLNPKAVIPEYGTEYAAGLDVVAIGETNHIDGAIAYTEYSTGLAIQLEPGYCALLMPRSSVSSNTSLILANSVGLLDSDYRGEIKFRFKNIMFGAGKKYKVGEKIGQILIIPYPKIKLEEVDELDDTVRESGGFGSTDIK